MKMEDNNRLASWLNDELSEAELQELRQEEDYAVLEKIKIFSADLKVKQNFDEDHLLEKIRTQQSKSNVRPLFWKKAMQIAALFVVFLGIGWYLQTKSITEEIAANGSTTAFALPDQSKVQLHSGSKITYTATNWDTNRKLTLEGEAYFKVAKGKKFEVITPVGTVAVLGTQFNVKARNNRIDVTCYEGKVSIQNGTNTIIITKGQTIAYNNNELIINHPITTQYPSWIAKELLFEKEHPKDVLEELKRHFDIQIESVNLPSSELFTGKLPGDNPDVALQIFASSYHLKPVKKAAQKYSFESVP